MKVTLIQPPLPNRKPKILEFGHERARPLALFYLAANLEKEGCEVELVDFQKDSYSDSDIKEKLRKNNSPIFGITALTDMRFEAINVARIIKSQHPNSLVIVGGVHFSKCSQDTLNHIKEIDAVVTGYGEETIVEIARAWDKKIGLEGIAGVVYREGNMIINNGDRHPPNLDKLPYYTKFTYEEYPENLLYHPNHIKAISVLSSRGCPYNCVFCAIGGGPYLTRSANLVVDEIEYWKDRFMVNAVNFFDYNLTAKPEHVKNLCTELIKRKLNIKWWCDSRVNIPLDLLDLMREAGCSWISIGVETGSPRILKKISKHITHEQVIKFINKCKQLHINITMLIMLSHPDETKEDLEETYTFVKKLSSKVDALGWGVTMIFPGSEIESIARIKNVIPKNFSWSMPYESEISRRLTSLPNIPVFIDKLTIEDIEFYMTKISVAKRHILKEIITLVKTPSRWELLNPKKNILHLRHFLVLLKIKTLLWWDKIKKNKLPFK